MPMFSKSHYEALAEVLRVERSFRQAVIARTGDYKERAC